jgi:hypothetical protein
VTLTLGEGEVRALDVVMTEPDAPKTLPDVSAEVEVAPGLFLVVGKDNLEPPFGAELPDEVGAALVTEATRLPIELEGVVIAAWYFASSPDGLPLVSIANTFGLSAGATVEVWNAGLPEIWLEGTETNGWVSLGTLTVDAEGTLLTGEVELQALSTLVLLQPS